VAPALVAKARPDGYTLLVNSSAQAYAAILRQDLPYDPEKDFIPVAPLTSQGYVLVAGRAAGLRALAELVSRARAKPDALKFGSPGVGSGAHFGVLRFNLEAKIRAVHVPDDSIAAAIARTVAGKTDYLLAPSPLVLTEIRAGNLVPLGVSSGHRSPLLPDVPTGRRLASGASTIQSGTVSGHPPELLRPWSASLQRTSRECCARPIWSSGSPTTVVAL
jgi:tripartite-type tricarboxylate transporter receptor subunit TctC